MKLIVQGSSDFRPDGGMASAGYLVQVGDTQLKLDFGRGNFMRLVQAEVAWNSLNAIAISHIHPDHVAGLFQYFQVYQIDYAEGRIERPVQLYGPRGFQQFFAQLRQAIVVEWAHLPEVHECFDDSFIVGDLNVRTALLSHAVDNVGYRVEHEDASLVYTGDTGQSDALIQLAKGVDTLLTECYATNEQDSPFHLRPKDIAKVAREAQVRRIILTHMTTDPAGREQRRKELESEFAGEILLAEDNSTFTI